MQPNTDLTTEEAITGMRARPKAFAVLNPNMQYTVKEQLHKGPHTFLGTWHLRSTSQGWTELKNAWTTDYSMLSSKIVLGCVMH